MSTKRVFIVDAHAFLHRSYHARKLFSIKTRLHPTTLTLLAAMLLSSAVVAEAKVLYYDGCGYFSDDDGVEGKKICEADFPREVKIKLKKPVEKEGATWRWKVRTTIGERNVARGSLTNLIFYENYVDRLLKPGQSPGTDRVLMEEISGGYTVRYYAGQGELKWEKTIEGCRIGTGVSSYDGSTLALLTECEGADRGGKRRARSIHSILTVYDNKGKEFMSFPAKPGVCRIVDDFWMSRRGEYMMVPCEGEGSSKFPYFIKPKERLFWKADKYYKSTSRMEKLIADEWPDSDEDSGRVEVVDLEPFEDDANDGARGMRGTGPAYDLDLTQVDWAPLKR